jgi:hypothetical protein
VFETGDIHTGFWWGNLGRRDHLNDIDIDGRIILKWCSSGLGRYGLDSSD